MILTVGDESLNYSIHDRSFLVTDPMDEPLLQALIETAREKHMRKIVADAEGCEELLKRYGFRVEDGVGELRMW